MAATKAEIVEIVAAERLRIMGILESDEGRSHPSIARQFALTTVMTADQANTAMANLPVENPFLEAMDHVGPLGIRASSPGATGTPLPEDAKAARIAEISKMMVGLNTAKGYTK